MSALSWPSTLVGRRQENQRWAGECAGHDVCQRCVAVRVYAGSGMRERERSDDNRTPTIYSGRVTKGWMEHLEGAFIGRSGSSRKLEIARIGTIRRMRKSHVLEGMSLVNERTMKGKGKTDEEHPSARWQRMFAT